MPYKCRAFFFKNKFGSLNLLSYICISQLKQSIMKQFILNVQFISLCVGALCLLFLLGAEPGTSEESMYDYEHFCDKGNFGYYLLWAFGLSVVLFITTTIIRFVKSINE